MHEFYKKYRPTTFKQVLGQPEAVKMLTNYWKSNRFPHTMLMSGPSGCGKTTLARIIRKKLNIGNADFKEINCADDRGIEMIRTIRSKASLAPIQGPARMYLIDEVHQLTTNAQDAFLKLLEDTPEHIYFILCTTDPHKLKATIRTRATEIAVQPLSEDDIATLVSSITKRENRPDLPTEVIEKLSEASNGSARKVLVLLDQIIDLDLQDQLNAIEKADAQKQAIDIARELIKPKPSWQTIGKLLREVTEDPETIRWMVLGYANSILMKGGRLSYRCYAIINAFRDNFFDSKKAGLTAACYEVVNPQD